MDIYLGQRIDVPVHFIGASERCPITAAVRLGQKSAVYARIAAVGIHRPALQVAPGDVLGEAERKDGVVGANRVVPEGEIIIQQKSRAKGRADGERGRRYVIEFIPGPNKMLRPVEEFVD